jgi:tetratricopeptide (TPR) repeat protein
MSPWLSSLSIVALESLIPAIAGLYLPTRASADTLYLKSGISITVTRAQEKDGQILYWEGDDQYSIDKSEVLKIENGDPPATASHWSAPFPGSGSGVQDLTRRDSGSSPQHDKLKMPLLRGPKQDDAYWTNLRNRIMVRDTIDDQRLAEIEIQNNNRVTADAFFLAAFMSMQRGDPKKASGYLDHAIRAMPVCVDLLEWQAIALSAQGRYAEADSQLERANILQPDSVELLRLLGLARYDGDRTADAVAAWKQAQQIAPDAETATLLRKAQRELELEERSKSKESRHFTLRYEGNRTLPALQLQILATLEDAYQDIARELSYEPVENVIVILYTQKEFMDITEAPSWAGALNDGKLRVPIGGISAVNPELERVLRHELTHSFLHWLASGRCPTWLNEGVAQLMEPRSASMYASRLGPLMLERKAIPFEVLQYPFTRFSPQQAEVAYAESLAAVEYLRDRYGMNELVRMLHSMGSGIEPEVALRNSTGLDYAVLQERIGEHMAKGE